MEIKNLILSYKNDQKVIFKIFKLLTWRKNKYYFYPTFHISGFQKNKRKFDSDIFCPNQPYGVKKLVKEK